jgi:hypothetical protein
MDATQQITLAYLTLFLLPLWLAVGFADWLCHRAARIETNAGWRESALHLVMLAEGAAPLLLALFFEVNALILVVALVAWLLHEATSYWDVHFADQHRHIAPIEQRVHDYLAVLPFMALSLLGLTFWPQALALVGLGPEPARWILEPKVSPLPAWYVTGFLALTILLGALPFLEEFWRCWRQGSRAGSGSETDRRQARPGVVPR